MMSIGTHRECTSFSTSIHLTHPTHSDTSIRGGIFRESSNSIQHFLWGTDSLTDKLICWPFVITAPQILFLAPSVCFHHLPHHQGWDNSPHHSPPPIHHLLTLLSQTCRRLIVRPAEGLQHTSPQVRHGWHILKLYISDKSGNTVVLIFASHNKTGCNAKTLSATERPNSQEKDTAGISAYLW